MAFIRTQDNARIEIHRSHKNRMGAHRPNTPVLCPYIISHPLINSDILAPHFYNFFGIHAFPFAVEALECSGGGVQKGGWPKV